jgi:hypothetical protein
MDLDKARAIILTIAIPIGTPPPFVSIVEKEFFKPLFEKCNACFYFKKINQ